MDGRLEQAFCWFFLLAARMTEDFLFRADSLLGLGSVQHFQSHLARLVRACARGPSRIEPQISFQILQLLPVILSPRIHVRQYQVRLGVSRFPEQRFACASLSLIQTV